MHEKISEGGDPPIPELSKPRTLKEAAAALGVGYHTVQRAAKRRLVPVYHLGTTRPYVKLADFIALMSHNKIAD